jgi:hypothetical protein
MTNFCPSVSLKTLKTNSSIVGCDIIMYNNKPMYAMSIPDSQKKKPNNNNNKIATTTTKLLQQQHTQLKE